MNNTGIYKKFFSFMLMCISALWANRAVRQILIKYPDSHAWKEALSNAALLFWAVLAGGLYLAFKYRSKKFLFTPVTLFFAIAAIVFPFLAGTCSVFEFGVSFFILAMAIDFLKILKKAFSCVSVFRSSLRLKKASFGRIKIKGALFDHNVISAWKNTEKLIFEIKSILRDLKTACSFEPDKEFLLLLDEIKKDIASRLIRLQLLIESTNQDAGLKIKNNIEKEIITAFEQLENLKSGLALMKIRSLTGYKEEGRSLKQALDLTGQNLRDFDSAVREV